MHRPGGPLCRGGPPQPDGAGAARRGPGGRAAGHGGYRRDLGLQPVPHHGLTKLPVDISNLVVSGTKITMETPHLAGFSTDQRPYEVWAKAAIQDLTNPDHVELRTLRAKVMMEDKSTVTMDARTGFFDSKQQMLDLRKDIFLQSSTGYEAKLSQAYIDINKGTVTSDEHVDVKLLNGTLTADKLRIINSGEIVRFEGNVVMNLVMETPPAPEPEPEPAPPPRTRSVTGKSANTK